MKKNVMVIREAIERVVTLLTRQKIKVTQRGANACVRYAKDGSILEVNLPFIPDDASDDFIAAVQGFLDHEVGHVLFTDHRVIFHAAKRGPQVASMHNMLEDVFIEKRMAEQFAGSGLNLDSVRKFFVSKITQPMVAKALAAGDENSAIGALMVVQVRAWGGQTACKDFLVEHPEADRLLAKFREDVGELADDIPNIAGSDEALILADRIIKRIVDAERKREEERRLKIKIKSKSEPGKEGDDEDGEGAVEKSKTEAKKEDRGEGREKPEDKGGSEPEDKDDGDPEDDGEGAGKSEDEVEVKEPDEGEDADLEIDLDADDPDDHDADERDKDDPEAAGPDKPTVSGDDDEPERDTDPEEDRKREKSADEHKDDKPEGDDPEESDDPVGLGTAGEGRGEDEDREHEEETGESTSSIDHEDAKSPEEGGEGDLSGPDLEEILKDKRDFDEDLTRALAEVAAGVLERSDYRIFSREWDIVEPAPATDRPGAIAQMDEETRAMTGVMTKHLERAMAAQSRVGFNPGMRSGRINSPSLFKVGVGDDRVFRQKYERQSRRTAVSLLIDCSGSMSGSRIQTAGTAAYALSSALERLRIEHEVIGFTTLPYYHEKTSMMRSAVEAETKRLGKAIRYGRSLPLYMPVFKGFDERLNAETKARIAKLREDPGYLCENPDGEAVQLAAHRLLSRKNVERHILIVLSDGYPACPPGHGLNEHLSTVVGALGGHMDVVGVGIQSDAVKRFYPKHVVLNDVNELPTTVVRQLSQLLLAA